MSREAFIVMLDDLRATMRPMPSRAEYIRRIVDEKHSSDLVIAKHNSTENRA